MFIKFVFNFECYLVFIRNDFLNVIFRQFPPSLSYGLSLAPPKCRLRYGTSFASAMVWTEKVVVVTDFYLINLYTFILLLADYLLLAT